MAYILDGKTIETTDSGYLVNIEDWNERVAERIAEQEGIELTERHWAVIHYLRDEYMNHGGNQPNERAIVKAMSRKWNTRVTSQDTFNLFPKMPSKQAGKIAGLPESRRKGGY